jgi:hypothetical protein
MEKGSIVLGRTGKPAYEVVEVLHKDSFRYVVSAKSFRSGKISKIKVLNVAERRDMSMANRSNG